MSDIVQLTSVDEKSLSEVNALLRQLSSMDRECSLSYVQRVLESPETEVWVAKENGTIIGMAALVLTLKPGGIVGRVEDVVVEEGQRGKGIGRLLMGKLIERGKLRGAAALHLSSRHSRTAANALYQKLGFKQHETNSYYMNL